MLNRKISGLIVVLLFVSNCFAQDGLFRGIVSDSTQRPLKDVELRVTGFNKTVIYITKDNGRFELHLESGDYNVYVQHPAYISQTFSLTIRTGEITEQQLSLLLKQPTALTEVTVTGKTRAQQIESGALTIKSIDIKNVINQNTVLADVADRIAGVRIRRSGSLGDKSDISINGLRGAAVRVFVDGLPIEILYPSFDISTIPLSNIERLDIYKGVVPVDVASDAMGGAINITTKKTTQNSLRAGYYHGSFNTHMADLKIGLANARNYYLNFSASYNYSDNDYKMNALVFEKNSVERVRRFNDAYQQSFYSADLGTHGKSWADDLRFVFNYAAGFKEVQNWARITSTALGKLRYEAHNYSGLMYYKKSFWENRIRFSTQASMGRDNITYIDTATSIYSWSGQVLSQGNRGEERYGYYDNITLNTMNRSTVDLNFLENHLFKISNIYSRQNRTGKNHLTGDGSYNRYLEYPQHLTKNVLGLQYEGRYFERILFAAAYKRYFYDLDGVENVSFEPIRKKDHFNGYNVALKYDFSQAFYVKTSYERGYLIPLFEQFVGDGATTLRNTNLKPENSDNVNLSALWTKQTGNWQYKVGNNFFFRKQHDIIYAGAGIVRRYENHDQVQTLGSETDASLQYKHWQLNLAATLLSKRFYKVRSERNRFLEGTVFPNDPTRYGNIELVWSKKGQWAEKDFFRAYVFYQHIGTFNHAFTGQNDNPQSRPELYVPVQNRVDAGCSYSFPRYHLTVAGNVINIFDQELYDNFSVPKPGRSFNIRLIYELNTF